MLNFFKTKGKNTKKQRHVLGEGRKENLPGADKKAFFLTTEKLKFILLTISFISFVSYLLLPDIVFFPNKIEIGDRVPEDIISPMDLDVQDKVATERVLEKIRNEQPIVFDFDNNLTLQLSKKISKGFSLSRQFFKKNINGEGEQHQDNAEFKEMLLDNEKRFQIALGIPLTKETLLFLYSKSYSVEIERGIINIIRPVLDAGVLLSKELFTDTNYKGVMLHAIEDDTERYLDNIDSILNIKAALLQLEHESTLVFYDNLQAQHAALEISSLLISPNVTFNKSATEKVKRMAEQSMKTLYFHIHRGELIIPAGEQVDSRSYLVLSEIYKYSDSSLVLQIFIGVFLIVLMVMFVFYLDIKRYKPDLLSNMQQFLFLTILFSGTILISKFTYFLLRSFVNTFPLVESDSIFYALPIATGAILTVIIVDVHTAIVLSFLTSLLMGMFFHDSTLYIFYIFVGNIVASFSAMECKKRSGLLKAGMLVGFANMAMLMAINLYQVSLFTMPGLIDLLFGFGGGIIVALASSFLLPVCESCFDVTTDIKLLELSDLNQPLLRNLLISAPGTYHHSMMVGTLAEEAAEYIGENPVLARVSCYYHDIGKIVKPEYYIENQIGIINRHDNLSPRMSSIIVTAHVKEGVDVAKRAKVPKEVLAIIQEHHGTRVIKFFYEKAKSAQGADDIPVSEKEYRYAGPRPQSKISGIIMMADALEACSRVLTDPSHSRIKTLVENVVSDIYDEKQLDESNLTITDLTKIKDRFTKTLLGIFHRRIDYPGVKYYEDNSTPEENKTDNGNFDRESASRDTIKSKTAGAGDQGNVININKRS